MIQGAGTGRGVLGPFSSVWSCAAGRVSAGRTPCGFLQKKPTNHLPCHFSSKKGPRWGAGSVNTLNYVRWCIFEGVCFSGGEVPWLLNIGILKEFKDYKRKRRIPVIGTFVCNWGRGCLCNVVENSMN